MRCWGDNKDNAFGDGGTRVGPAKVAGTQGADGLFGGNSYQDNDTWCIVRAGKTFCWGYDGDALPGSADLPGPTAIAVLAGFEKIAFGGGTGCGLKKGTVSCWGSAVFGQLGNGKTDNSDVPVAVTGLSGITDLDCGQNACCAVGGDSRVHCWGMGAGTATLPWSPRLGRPRPSR
ncbi:MAG: hypothetical protein ACI9WU_001897 [Myxococcota bacterium]